MDTLLFALALAIATVGPIVAIRYLSPLLDRVLRGLCDADGGAEFWIRCAYLMAVSGSLLMTLAFGCFDDRSTVVDAMRRALCLTVLGVFATVAIISRNVWSQVRSWLEEKRRATVGATARAAAAPASGS